MRFPWSARGDRDAVRVDPLDDDFNTSLAPKIAARAGDRLGPMFKETEREQPRTRAGGSRGFLLLALVAALGMGAVARRDWLVRVAPDTAGIFAGVGLPVNLRGLELRRVNAKLIEEGDARVLAVEGDIGNIRQRAGKIPDMLVSVRAADGHVVYSWTSPPPKKEIGVGETVYFRARLAAPPADGSDVKIQFAALAPEKPAPGKK